MNKLKVVVTGANSGIGLSIVKLLLEKDYEIYACIRSGKEILEDLKNKNLHIFEFDLQNFESMKLSVREIFKISNGEIYGLVNCAGIAYGGLFNMTPIEKLKEIFEVNFFSQLQLIQLISKKMILNKQGSIVNISSTSGIFADAGTLAYGSSKSALIFSTRVLAVELGKYNIRVNSISPAMVKTRMLDMMDESSKQMLSLRKSIPGEILPSDIAELVEFLVSDKSTMISGQNIRIDQGMYA